MYFRQFRVADMGCSTYLVADEGQAIVIDPQIRTEPYLNIAKKEGFKIVGIIDTHIHADYVSGNRRLAAQTGAKLYLHKDAAAEFEFTQLQEGDVIEIGKVRLEIIHSPGHTPESILLKVLDTANPQTPPHLLTGDTIFVGDVGRPDLAGAEGASQLFFSLKRIVPTVETGAVVYPGHFAGSLCGRNLSAAHSTLWKRELETNYALQIKDEDTFVHYLLDDLPPKPADFLRIIGINRQGAPVELAKPTEISPAQAKGLMTGQHARLVDVRDSAEYWQEHVIPSLNVPVYSNQFGVNVTHFVPPEAPIILIAVDEEDVEEAVTLLAGVGRTAIAGYILGQNIKGGFEVMSRDEVAVETLRQLEEGAFAVLDVRESGEVLAGTVEGAVNIPLRQLYLEDNLEQVRHLTKTDGFESLIVICNNGNRSSVAASFLCQHGLPSLNLAGGYNAYQEKTLTTL
jgi:hydroxyacylglutathione hydrolase